MANVERRPARIRSVHRDDCAPGRSVVGMLRRRRMLVRDDDPHALQVRRHRAGMIGEQAVQSLGKRFWDRELLYARGTRIDRQIPQEIDAQPGAVPVSRASAVS